MKTIYCRILLGISAIFICLGCQPATLTKIATFSPTETAKPIVTATMKPVTHATPSPVIAVPAEVLDGTTVIFWHPWDPTLAAVIASQIVDFNKTNSWGIVVNFVEFGSLIEMRKAVSQSILDGKVPDVIAAPLDELQMYQQRGLELLDLNPYAASDDWGFTADQATDYFPAIWQGNLVNGSLLGIPAYTTARILFYNQTWAAELGLQTRPATRMSFPIRHARLPWQIPLITRMRTMERAAGSSDTSGMTVFELAFSLWFC